MRLTKKEQIAADKVVRLLHELPAQVLAAGEFPPRNSSIRDALSKALVGLDDTHGRLFEQAKRVDVLYEQNQRDAERRGGDPKGCVAWYEAMEQYTKTETLAELVLPIAWALEAKEQSGIAQLHLELRAGDPRGQAFHHPAHGMSYFEPLESVVEEAFQRAFTLAQQMVGEVSGKHTGQYVGYWRYELQGGEPLAFGDPHAQRLWPDGESGTGAAFLGWVSLLLGAVKRRPKQLWRRFRVADPRRILVLARVTPEEDLDSVNALELKTQAICRSTDVSAVLVAKKDDAITVSGVLERSSKEIAVYYPNGGA